jgi:hypothetical protein
MRVQGPASGKFRPLLAVSAGLTLLLAACGGGSDGGGGLSEKRAGEVAKQYILHVFGLLTGDTDADALIESFAPECREGVEASDVEAAIGFIAIFLPDLAEADIEDVDLGKLKYTKTDEGILVIPEDPDGMRLKVDGKFVSANDFFADMGFEDSEDTPAEADEPLLIVERDGKAYIGDCSGLQDFAGE